MMKVVDKSYFGQKVVQIDQFTHAIILFQVTYQINIRYHTLK